LISIFLVSCSSISSADKTEKEPWELAMETEVWEPVPPIVEALPNTPPSDAIILFDGKSLNQWTALDGSEAAWKIEGDTLTVTPTKGDIKTKKSFCDIQLH